MNHKKKGTKRDYPKWVSKPATVSMKREVEDALVKLYDDKGLNPRYSKHSDCKLADIHPYLVKGHPRWEAIGPQEINTSTMPCFKSLCTTLHNLKNNSAALEELLLEHKKGSTSSD